MGIDPISLGLIGSAVAGGVGGAIKGGKGTPDESKLTSQTQTTTLPGASRQERDLQSQALQAFQRQQQLAQGQEQSAAQFDPLRQQAMQGFSDIIGGGAFNLTPDEMARLQQQQQALVAQGQAPIERLLEERMRGVLDSAGGRNLRGQALGALQGQVLQAGAQELGDITRQANAITAQQALQIPGQRIAAQSPFLQGGISFADNLRQQAIQNQQALSNPALLQSMLSQRLAQGTTTTSGNTTIPGQRGGFGGALLGGLTGGAIGAKTAGNVFTGLEKFGFGNSLGNGAGGGSSNNPFEDLRRAATGRTP